MVNLNNSPMHVLESAADEYPVTDDVKGNIKTLLGLAWATGKGEGYVLGYMDGASADDGPDDGDGGTCNPGGSGPNSPLPDGPGVCRADPIHRPANLAANMP